jgi:hypothetical protein
MKLVAVAASMALHLAGYAAIPTDTRDDAAANTPSTAQPAVAVNASACKCDLEIGALDCPRSDSTR